MIDSKVDCFAELQKVLGDKYNAGLIRTDSSTSSPLSYIGNATFYKKSFTLVARHELVLHKNPQPFPSDSENYQVVGRVLLHLVLNIKGTQISFLNTHFAWAKTSIEQPHHTKQGEILINYLRNVPKPFILTTDMNIQPDQPLIQKIDTLSQNLTTKFQIKNTLNPRTHSAQQLFPKGIAVDYIFVSNDLRVKKFEVINEDLSDHLALTAEIEI